MFLDPLPAFRGNMDRGGARKPSAMEILQHRSAGSKALENADDQNAIALLPQKSHTNSYRMLSTWESMPFNFGYKRLMPSVRGRLSCGEPNATSNAIAYAKLFSCIT